MYQSFKYIFILLFLQLTNTVVAQNYTLSYRILDNEDGLLGSKVSSFVEDKNGFIWMATQRGIARYDGHQFQWFTEINSPLRGLPEGEGTPIVEDDKGNIWSLSSGKIDIINPLSLEIQPLEEKLKDVYSIKESISNIKQSKDNYIILKTQNNHKWYVYHSSTGFVELNIKQNQARFIYLQDHAIWSKKNKKLIGYDYKTGKKIAEYSHEGKGVIKPVKNYNTGKHLFWLSNGSTLKLFEGTEDGLLQVFSTTSQKNTQIATIIVNYLPKSNLLITNFDTEKKGLSIIDLDQQQLTPINNAKDELIANAKLTWPSQPTMTSQENILWGRSKRSILLFQIKETHFQQYLSGVSTRGLGVFDNYLFANKRKISLNQPNLSEVRNGENGQIMGVEQQIKDELWIGNQNSIARIDVTTNEVKQVIPSSFFKPKFWTIVKSKEGQWWAGGLTQKLMTSHFPNHDSLFLFTQYNEFTALSKKSINHLLEDDDYIWASSPIGLYLIHKKKGVIQRYHSEAESAFQLPINHVHFLYKDAADTYWLATSSQGLIQFQVNSKFEITNYKRYTTQEGLSSDVLYAIIEDDKERLWISTLNGISCLDKKTEQVQVFNKTHGIQELEFNRNSYTKAEDGRIFFGSLNGVTAFYPDEVLQTEPYNFPIHITQFYSYEKKKKHGTDQTQKILETQRIVIPPSIRFFRFNVTMLDVFHSNKIQYSYKIEGLVDDFQQIDGNAIEIGGLPYGRYTLRVRGQGADNRFSEQELSIPLIVVRPFYLRWWFILIVLVIAGLSIYQTYLWRIRQLEERKTELEMLVMERTTQIRKDKSIIEEQATQLKELDELKSKFFANISHELRTPLTLLLAPMDNIIKNEKLTNNGFTYLQMMRQNGSKLLKRINELLDLSRLDANRLEVNEEPTFLYPFFKTLLSTFESAANLKGIKLLFNYQLDENIQVNLDDDKVEKIVSNYLSNAFKFTPKNGQIELNVSKSANKLLVSVSDTGIGILSKDLIKIFDRFYQSKTEKQAQGTGIGLSLCRELAKVLNGKVWATSYLDSPENVRGEISKGSTFYLELPLVETFAIKEDVEEQEVIVPVIPKTANTSTSQKFKPNILVVEDNPDLRQFLVMLLEEDYNVVAVENGKEALQQLAVGSWQFAETSLTRLDRVKNGALPTASTATAHCQLIISDIMMPIMDGIELLTKVKNTKELQHIPMIMLTARQSLDVKIEALRIGVDDYLTKPFKEEELKARVANLIKNSQSRQVITEEDTPEIEPTIKTASAADLVWLKELETILAENIGNNQFKMPDAARQMAISQRRLQQKIKFITGLTPKQYQRSILLNKARNILKSGQVQTVSEVLYQVGIENRHYFSKIYKEEFGIKPIEELKG